MRGVRHRWPARAAFFVFVAACVKGSAAQWQIGVHVSTFEPGFIGARCAIFGRIVGL